MFIKYIIFFLSFTTVNKVRVERWRRCVKLMWMWWKSRTRVELEMKMKCLLIKKEVKIKISFSLRYPFPSTRINPSYAFTKYHQHPSSSDCRLTHTKVDLLAEKSFTYRVSIQFGSRQFENYNYSSLVHYRQMKHRQYGFDHIPQHRWRKSDCLPR